jgi:hypothetical protein
VQSVKDTLFLLKPGFEDGPGRFFCTDCATVEGMLSFYPGLREKVNVVYVGYKRPRGQVVELLGPDHQSAPCLVLHDGNHAKVPEALQPGESLGRKFLDDAAGICHYLASVHGADPPH